MQSLPGFGGVSFRLSSGELTEFFTSTITLLDPDTGEPFCPVAVRFWGAAE